MNRRVSGNRASFAYVHSVAVSSARVFIRPRFSAILLLAMKTITIDVLKEAAHRLLFDLSEQEYQTLYGEFGILLRQMDLIGHVEGLEEMEPMTFPFECTTSFLREDEPMEPLEKEDVLRNAGNVQDGQIKLPKVVL